MQHQRATRFLAAHVMIISLAACGFTPVYGPEAQTGHKLSDIQIASPNSREGYLFVQYMEERLGRNLDAGTVLKHNISIFEDGLDVIGASRSQVVGNIRYQLVSQDDDQVITTGSVQSFTAYSQTVASTGSYQRNATERLIKILADKVITDLTFKLSSN